MKSGIDPNHPLYRLFIEHVHETFVRHGVRSESEIEEYLTGLLVGFMHTDGVFAIRDRQGRPVTTVTDMIAEGDVRLNADSFAREREVHKHIGDFILFWSGVYPEFLRQLKLHSGRDLLCDYVQQGKESYYIASTFDHGPYRDEAATFMKLSVGFEEYSERLRVLRETIPLHVASDPGHRPN